MARKKGTPKEKGSFSSGRDFCSPGEGKHPRRMDGGGPKKSWAMSGLLSSGKRALARTGGGVSAQVFSRSRGA